MKYAFALITLLFVGTAQAEEIVTTTAIQCYAKIDGKIETFKARVSGKRLVFWSENKMVEASKTSFFSRLTDMDFFGLEGKASFTGKNGFYIMNANSSFESIDIGVTPQLDRGFYNYQDIGSGNGHRRIPLLCQKLWTESEI